MFLSFFRKHGKRWNGKWHEFPILTNLLRDARLIIQKMKGVLSFCLSFTSLFYVSLLRLSWSTGNTHFDFFLVADTRLYTLPCRSVRRSVGPSVTFLNSERFLHYCSCPTVRDCFALYPALLISTDDNAASMVFLF